MSVPGAGVLWVGLGGVCGALARWTVAGRVERTTIDTFLVNVLGSFLLGLVTTTPVGDPVALAVGTGFCGAFTTFSSFAFETVDLAGSGEPGRAALVAVGTLVAALSAVVAGTAVGAAL